MILFHANDERIHEGFVDWTMWHFGTTWLRATFLPVEQAKEVDLFVDLLESEIIKCRAFLEILKVD